MEKSIPIRNEGGEASDIIQTSEWRSEAEEYEMISTPTAFHKSRAMVETEATVKRKKRRRKRKRMNSWLKLSQFHPHHPNPLEAGKPAFDSEQAGKDECVRTVEVSKWDFIEISDNVPQKLAVDIDVKENKMIELVQAVKCRTEGIGDKAGSKEAIDMSSSSSVDDGLISNISSGTRIGDIMSAKGTINVDGEMVRTELKTFAAEETVDAGMKEMHSEKAKCVEIVKLPGKSAKSTMLRNHLKPRYFDPPNGSWTRCLSCGEDHPAAENRMLQKHVKACFLCRRLQHIGKHCSQGQYCLVCRGTFDQASDCPKKQKENNLNYNVCLRCGDSGHDMFSCRSDYSADDLKKIRCYICNDFGHLSCVKLPDASPTEVSCYTCGQSGHFGSHARRVHAEMRSVGSSSAPNRGPQNDAKGATQESLIVNIIQ
ncbi:hypothetical protein ES319_D04G106500v1 [Gossypium barbadense]|uniref:CCHC-type domain-containing protein n=2 Tax=Gossypium TaxID=3633 RepID=A0A5J5S1E8_GOSBA|nr:hypothetical protein ES319_D04G106500v1 [Gossypium barbadense]KAB2034763.1 hypothetical protein ES319_D04G106500v1 [Gossypium barbadense]TYG73592.1 hypothetical protein ES288_D04G113900v1 [Gossypium darwinii]TYG73599.1 hypothetical protein ES288_D04G113900v1 [Gossypium darwinii]